MYNKVRGADRYSSSHKSRSYKQRPVCLTAVVLRAYPKEVKRRERNSDVGGVSSKRWVERSIAAFLCLLGSLIDGIATPLPLTEAVNCSIFQCLFFAHHSFFHSANYLTVSSFRKPIQRLPLPATDFMNLKHMRNWRLYNPPPEKPPEKACRAIRKSRQGNPFMH